MGRRSRWVIVGAVLVVMVGAAAVFLLRGDAGFSDAPGSDRLGLYVDEIGVIHIQYGKCRGELTPHLEVWEEAKSERLPWAVFLRVDSSSTFWLSRRENGVTFESGRRDELVPIDDARVTVRLTPHRSERIEVVDLMLSDIPGSEGKEVLLGDGRKTERDPWVSTVGDAC